jgi:hypothetical protein
MPPEISFGRIKPILLQPATSKQGQTVKNPRQFVVMTACLSRRAVAASGYTPGRTSGLECALAGLKRGTPRMPALLRRTDHAVVIHMHDSKTLAVAEGPFVIVE